MSFINDRLLALQAETKARYDQRVPTPVAPSATARQISPGQFINELTRQGRTVPDFIADSMPAGREPGRERAIGTADFMAVNYLSRGVLAGRSVGRVNVNAAGEEGFGTGFLIGENLLITNNHVLAEAAEAADSFVEFDFELDEQGLPRTAVAFKLLPDRFFMTDKELDFTVVFVGSVALSGERKLSEFGRIALIEAVGKINIDQPVSIIQHPNGQRKAVALRNNTVKAILDNFIQYETDTEPGSSGSPVFNDKWELVALHHSGVPKKDNNGAILNRRGGRWQSSEGENEIDWLSNEGVRISKIIAHLRASASAGQRILLRNVVSFENTTPATTAVITTTTPATGAVAATTYYDQNADAAQRTNYYQRIDRTKPDLFTDLNQLLDQTHINKLPYKPAQFLYPVMDKHPNGKLQSIYSGQEFTAEELIRLDELADVERTSLIRTLAAQGGIIALERFNDELDRAEASFPFNCEHVVPQSWFGKQSPMRGDLHHLFTCEVRCNSFRSNHPYIDFPNFTPEEIARLEVIRQACGMGENNRFEPERNKGAVARATLYFLIRYPRQIASNYKLSDLQTLLAWHRNFPVSVYEQHRNVVAGQLQGNRNPLIDFPNLDSKIDFTKGL